MTATPEAQAGAPADVGAAFIEMIVQSVRFANWAAGEGICPVEGELASAPDDFLLAYSDATGATDWDGLDTYVSDRLRALQVAEARALAAEAEADRLRAALAKAEVIDMGNDIKVESRGNGKWVVTNFGNVLGADGLWQWEPMPSSRDDEFIARTRFDIDEAFRRARTATVSGEGMG